jgi:flagellar motor switch protein FliM
MNRSTADHSRQPSDLSPSGRRWLYALEKKLAAELGPALSTPLQIAVDVQPAGIERLSYGKFIAGLAAPTCFNVLKAAPWNECFLLDVDLSILYPMIDRLLGGCCDDEPAPRRPLSEIELPLAARLVRAMLEPFRSVWRDVAGLEIETLRVDNNPRLSRTLPSDERMVSLGFQLAIGGRSGMLRFGLPCRAVERFQAEQEKADATAATEDAAESETLVEIDVTVATTSLMAGELADLRVGDILVTETAAENPLVVSVAGRPKFLAAPGVHRGRKAVRITEEGLVIDS